jgi:hypothetical protein
MSEESTAESNRFERERACDRCSQDIHDLAPAATMQFGGALQSNEKIMCGDCMESLIDWWEGTLR